jgi:hypothetical protein
LFVCLFVCLLVCLFVCLSVCLFACLLVSLFVCLFVCLFAVEFDPSKSKRHKFDQTDALHIYTQTNTKKRGRCAQAFFNQRTQYKLCLFACLFVCVFVCFVVFLFV